MKLENPIGWTDATTNAVIGCSRTSPGCKNCYAEICPPARRLRAKGIETWGPKGVRHPVNFEPVFRRLNKLCICDRCHETYELSGAPRAHFTARPGGMCFCGGPLRRIRLFADSNSDWLDDRWPVGMLPRFLDAIRLAPNVDTLLLTKRPKNFTERLTLAIAYNQQTQRFGMAFNDWGSRWTNGCAPANVWLGVSVENQPLADQRIPELLRIPAAVRFVSAEPILEPFRLYPAHPTGTELAQGLGADAASRLVPLNDVPAHAHQFRKDIHWVIVGGESGSNFRTVPVEAITSIADQCRAAGVPCYVKQDCGRLPGRQGRIPDEYWKTKEFPARSVA